MALKNQAVVLESVKQMVLKPYPMPKLGENDLLIRIIKVGICGSDVHYWQHGRIGNFVCNGPMVLGHESSGVVAKVGSAVTNFAVGDRVALEPGIPCSACDQCLGGKYNLCPDIAFFATPPVHGSLATFVSHPAKYTFKIPNHMTLEEAAMCEPMSVSVYACVEKAKIKKGDSVAIFGAGPIGTITALIANGMEAGKVILCDIQPSRLRFCKSLLPNLLTVNTSGKSVDEVVGIVKGLNGGYPVDSSIDCAGVESVINACIRATKNGGAVCLVGMGKPFSNVAILDAACREVDLCGVFRYRNTYPKCIELQASKKVNLNPLITHHFEFTNESVHDAFETCRTGRDGAIKCMISLGDDEETLRRQNESKL